MDTHPALLGALFLGLAVSLTVNVRQSRENDALQARLDDLPRQATAAPRETTRTVYAEGLGGDAPTEADGEKPPLDDAEAIAADLAATDPSLILSLPEVEAAMESHIQEQLTEKRKAWQSRQLAQTLEGLETYAESVNMPDETRTEVESIIEEAMIDIASLREDRHAGAIPDDEAFKELGTVRDEFTDSLVELIGEEEAARLQETLTGPLSRTYY
jgi:hypothetical protein